MLSSVLSQISALRESCTKNVTFCIAIMHIHMVGRMFSGAIDRHTELKNVCVCVCLRGSLRIVKKCMFLKDNLMRVRADVAQSRAAEKRSSDRGTARGEHSRPN